MKKLPRSIICCLFVSAFAFQASAQINPTLSIQGILKKANGVAVDDGTYNITFKLYTAETGGSPVWQETQNGVEVSSGIYSAVLGVNTPLNAPFDQIYYLGVTVGSTELTPRILLTSAPYALSLIGQNNTFPGSGKVVADSIEVNGNVQVHGAVLARGGAPGLNGANKNGFAFSGNSGDNDSGMFSTGDGKVSLYANNTEIVAVTPSNVQVNTSMTANNVAIVNNGSISYNGLNDWRLVETDYFDNDAEGWEFYTPLSGQYFGWNNPSGSGAVPRQDFGTFIGNILYPSSNDHVIKKQFTVAGSFTQIKVRFRYFFIDTWDFDGSDRAWAAFSTNASGNGLRVAWESLFSYLNNGNGEFNARQPHFLLAGKFRW